MQIIGAGLPRTGTMSMQAALTHLGYPCYHMECVVRDGNHLKAWDDFISGREQMAWKRLFEEYTATVDAPACFYVEELLQEYPDAKVVLTIRDADGWFSSISKLNGILRRLRPIGRFIPRLGRFLSFIFRFHAMHGIAIDSDDKSMYIKTFNDHNRAIQQLVPQEQLLVFEVKDGWEPLCNFLGCEITPNVPFPHLNSGGDTIRAKFEEIFLTVPRRIALLAIGVVALIVLLWVVGVIR